MKLTTVGAPAPHVTETTVTRADAPKVLEYMGWLRHPVGTRSLWWRHAPDAVAQHRSPLHLNGRCRLAHLFRCSGSPSQRNSHRPHGRPRGDEVRRLAATERRVRQAVSCRNAQRAAPACSKVMNGGNDHERCHQTLDCSRHPHRLQHSDTRGYIEVTSIREISWEDLSDKLARDTGFKNLVDMMRTAKHGTGQHLYYIRFRYVTGPTRAANTIRKRVR